MSYRNPPSEPLSDEAVRAHMAAVRGKFVGSLFAIFVGMAVGCLVAARVSAMLGKPIAFPIVFGALALADFVAAAMYWRRIGKCPSCGAQLAGSSGTGYPRFWGSSCYECNRRFR